MAITSNGALDYASSNIKRLDVPGADYLGVVELQGDSSYVTNGYPITAALFGLMNLKFCIPLSSTDVHVAAWDQVNQKLKLFVRTTGVELGNGVTAATTKIWCLVAGT